MFTTPFGHLWLHTQDQDIVALTQVPPKNAADPHVSWLVAEWLNNYFHKKFSSLNHLTLAPKGTIFQRRVWDLLMEIPVGRVETYGSLAKRLQSSPRAVGHALAKNPIPILIPCHRVVAASALGGYSGMGGVIGKKVLLTLEGVFPS